MCICEVARTHGKYVTIAVMNVALVYDRVNKWGGAERVLLALHELFPDAPLFTAVYNAPLAPWAKTFQVQTSFLQSVPGATSAHEYFPLFMPVAFEQFSFDAYDLVISVTSEAAKGIITKPHTKHICICLTPTRYLWSGYDTYFPSPFVKTLAYPAVSYLRSWDMTAAWRPDVMVGISDTVKKRIEKYYGREADVIYPPVAFQASALSSSLSGNTTSPRPENQELRTGYFLVVSRLVPYKRIDLAMRACSELNLPLVIVGKGSEEQKLRAIAGPTVRFVGSVTDRELASYYENCQALIFPGEEDFGITVVEAQSFGKPVIAYGKGGASETIREGKTGVFFNEQTVSALKPVLTNFVPSKYKAEDCRVQAARFSTESFHRDILKVIDKTVS